MSNSKLPSRNPPVNKSATHATRRAQPVRNRTLPGGQPDISPNRQSPQKGDLPGCIQLRPLVDYTMDRLAHSTRQQPTLPHPEPVGKYVLMLIIAEVGPQMLSETLSTTPIAYVGSDVHKWIAFPIQGLRWCSPGEEEWDEHLVYAELNNEHTQEMMKEVAGLILGRSGLYGTGEVIPTLTPFLDPELDMDPTEEIVHREGEALDLERTYKSIHEVFRLQNKDKARHVSNAVIVFESDPLFQNTLRFDELDQKIWARAPLPWSPRDSKFPREWQETDEVEAATWLAGSQWDLILPAPTVGSAARAVARRCTVHKVRDKLKTLKWDGVPRIGSHDNPAPGWLATYFGCCNEGNLGKYVRLVGRYWLMGAVARAFDPGCKVDTVLILEGPGGDGKSDGTKILTNIVDNVFRDTMIDWSSKDKYQQLNGVWVYEFAEISSFSKQDQDKVKAYISSAVDSYRRSYGHETADYPRHCVFMGTVNPGDDCGYLNGKNQRRNWPVRVWNVDKAAIYRDREQIWAEAVNLYKFGKNARDAKEKVPIWARWWTGQDDAELWELEGGKRNFSGDAIVETLRKYLFKAGGYFDNDVRAQLKSAKLSGLELSLDTVEVIFKKPWQCLDQDLLIDAMPTKLRTGDGRRIASALRELGLSVDPQRPPIRQQDGKIQGRHAVLVSPEQDWTRRYLLGLMIQALGERQIAEYDDFVELRDFAHGQGLYRNFKPKAVEDLPGELLDVIKELKRQVELTPDTQTLSRKLLDALSKILGFELLPPPKPEAEPTERVVQSDVQSELDLEPDLEDPSA